MRKRLLAVAFLGAVTLSGFAASSGRLSAAPGPNGHNDFGLCTAYFAGSAKGQEMKRKAPPFVALEAAAEAANQTVEEYCADKTPGGR